MNILGLFLLFLIYINGKFALTFTALAVTLCLCIIIEIFLLS